MAVTLPDWADTLLDVIGVAWPNVDEDAYREMADALREFAEDLEDDGQLANNHFQRLISSGEGESIKALSEHWEKVKGKHIKDIAGAARTVAGAMDKAAGAVEAMKVAAIGQLGYLAAEAGIALAAIPVTGGLSALLGAGAIRICQEAIKRGVKECVKEAVGYIVSALTEPAVAALEGIAADLVVQLGAMAIGLQDGVDLGQAKQAGKDGFKEGVQSGKESLKLASAGGAGGGSGLSDLFIDHDEHDRAHGKLGDVSTRIHGRTTSKLHKAKSHHGRTRGRDSIAQAIDPVADKAMAALVKATKQVGDHVGKTLPKAVKQISTDHKNNDADLAARFARVRNKDDNGHGRGRGADHRKGDAGARTKPDALHLAKDDSRRNSIPLGKTRCATDPVDVATGEMLLPHTDLSLPGVLPLVLSRTHLSNYRYGQWFGRTWASTLDERIELDPVSAGAVWAREDGSLLVYPRLPALGGEPVLPVEGPRLALEHAGTHEDVTTYTVTDPIGVTRHFTGSPYRESPAYWLSSVEDRHGSRLSFARRPDGAPTSVKHSGGYLVQVSVEDGRVGALHLRTPDGLVQVKAFGYDERGNLAAVTNSSGRALGLAYDAHDRVVSWTDRNNSTYTYVYDSSGRVVRTLGPDGFLSSSFSYEGRHTETGHRITRYTDSAGATTVFHINDALQIVAETDALGATTHYSFDSADRLELVRDALGHTTRLERDAGGRVVAMTAADGERTTAAYNGLGLPVEVVERGGRRHGYEYDEAGNRTAVIGPGSARTEYAYDGAGAIARVLSPADGSTSITNNAAGLPMVITARNGARATCTRDAFGRVISVTDALGGTLRQGWTIEGLPSWRELPDGTREEWAWDGEGNLLSHTDRTGRVTTHEHTHFDRPVGRSGPDGPEYGFAYDTELRLAEVTDARGRTWRYTYDRAGRLVAETDFDNRTLTYAYDAIGRLIRRTNAAGQSLTYERDVLGRVLRIRDDSGATTEFGYAATGALREVASPQARITFEADAAGRIVSETVNGLTMSYAYDEEGRLTSRRTPSGAVSTLTYGPEGLSAHRVGEHIFRFDRDAMGRETGRTLDHRLVVARDLDPVGRLSAQAVTTADATVLEQAFSYRADGIPVAIDDTLTGRRAFDLDSAGRITGVRARGWSEQYAYNAAGDQTRTDLPPQAPGQDHHGERTYEGSRLTRSGRTTYSYDPQGRLTERATRTLSGKQLTWHFSWDARDQLTQVRTPHGTVWHYLYDGLGRRISKTHLELDGSVRESVQYTWDGPQLAEQQSGDITLTWDYAGLYPLAQREARTEADQEDVDRRFFAIVTGLDGSPHYLLTPEGDVAWRARTTVWGAAQWNRDATAYTPLRHPGQYFDAETGLHYNVHRYYDPHTGRYISPDPLGLAPATNHYAYVPNPFVMSDPLGLAGCEPDHTWGGRVVFVQDEHGRPFEMHATITRDMLKEGTHANNNIKPPGFVHGTDHNQARAHMLARMLGGTGDHPDNLFTLTQNPTNSPHMRDLEQMIYDAVAGDPANNVAGQTVQYSVYLDYTDDQKDSVPSRVYMQADGSNGFHMDTDFANPDHAAQQHRRRRGIR
ncbi:RHS repeat-associated core domain-containing protein [Streptomyces sp. NPDC032472]|uniref:RHS repeat-associated core domain-containing protein n=1 Tax=Streptomyces sp. NPDC032472 TaxID=3155018 RepID=UPI0033DCE6F1